MIHSPYVDSQGEALGYRVFLRGFRRCVDSAKACDGSQRGLLHSPILSAKHEVLSAKHEIIAATLTEVAGYQSHIDITSHGIRLESMASRQAR